ncbi:pre-mRNA splicing factor ATP-dependent RNA helicase PRP43 [Drechmeria coniospora]|uniref:Pre-mRNA splicing factor ATP-dependent RNA helicase PRP43 n=1 Tax=Drechmeria coniospora TaxID=98403 RepID=A0A151GCZ5_DRECN|nr:pre-mRNA splicing factor ATP-dependent RNA helicase PRP43 [Drechmeria coniospora]KYK54978.1 pre-mRNA splicing factor ATP-dependent RNA helicase PRP43 [Drechmeria coniospora]
MTSETPTNRRRLNASSSSDSAAVSGSPTFAPDVAENLELHSLLDPIADGKASPNATALQPNLDFADSELKRMLSIRNPISTLSTAAERHNQAQTIGTESFKKIGAGAYGTILAQDGKLIVFKLAKSGDDDALRNDYEKHSLIARYFNKYSVNELGIPECIDFIPKSNIEFFSQRPSLTQAAEALCYFPTGALISERILPLPLPVRQLLIDKYCSEKIKAEALCAVANKDCLIRVYLGSMAGRGIGKFFSLRNFKMHLGMMHSIQLDVDGMARRMGIAMAVMHWAAMTDARDVEFILGSATAKTTIQGSPSSYTLKDLSQRVTQLWVLDFNQVRSITMDAAGVNQAVEAAIINDPYIPRPLRNSSIERSVWSSFVKSYIEASDMIIQDQHDPGMAELPRMFIQGFIDVVRQMSLSQHK